MPCRLLLSDYPCITSRQGANGLTIHSRIGRRSMTGMSVRILLEFPFTGVAEVTTGRRPRPYGQMHREVVLLEYMYS